MTDASSLPYHEPSIVTILQLSSFLLLSNLLNYCLDRILYCGLIGQILIGVWFGTPGAKWLDDGAETAIVQLGYLGLVLLVYEGGLSTSFQSLKANIVLSIAVALTGICVPIGLSFALGGFAKATPLQSFAAGAALCSTSLGTTFTVLGTTGLTTTRLGTVVTSAAMLDDVVGLLMVQVIQNLGAADSDFNAVTIIRPVFISIAFAVISPLVCYFIVRPLTLYTNEYRSKHETGMLNKLLSRDETAFCINTAILLAMVTGSTYAGTSNLFASYVAGAGISWFDSELPHHVAGSGISNNSQEKENNSSPATDTNVPIKTPTGQRTYERFFSQANDRILKPFFFASIGFSIPITRMFTGGVVWRGVIYTIFMLIGKLMCGLWLIRFAITLPRIPKSVKALLKLSAPHFWGKTDGKESKTDSRNVGSRTKPGGQDETIAENTTRVTATPTDAIEFVPNPNRISAERTAASSDDVSSPTRLPSKPFSLYPAGILGLAMVARGEIGFLISALADSNGIFTTDGSDQIFLIVTWAIVLCTIIGPIGVGLLVRRLKKLEAQKANGPGGRDVLGVWGVR